MKAFLNKIIRNVFDSRAILIGPKTKSKLNIKDIHLAKDFKLRIYKPSNIEKGKVLPVLIYYHGGGWTVGSIKSYNSILRYLCHHTGFIVVGIEYRKAPEYKSPQAVNDALEGYNWTINNIDAMGGDINKIMIGGDSAGGNLTCVVLSALQAKQHPFPIKQVLIYPVLDVSEKAIKKARDYKRWWVGKLGCKILEYQLKLYLNDYEETKSHLVFPDASSLNLKNTKTLIITAEFDPLFIAAEDYIKDLQQKNYAVTHKHYPRTFHGFVNFAGISNKGKAALKEVVNFLKN